MPDNELPPRPTTPLLINTTHPTQAVYLTQSASPDQHVYAFPSYPTTPTPRQRVVSEGSGHYYPPPPDAQTVRSAESQYRPFQSLPPRHRAASTPDLHAREIRSGNSTPPSLKQPRRTPMTAAKKAEKILQLMSELGTTLGEFLYVISNWHDEPAGKFIRNHQGHGVMMQKFLDGEGVNYKPMQIIELWYTHPGGRRVLDQMYSLDIAYQSIANVRVGITSMAAQLVKQEMKREQRQAVKGKNGLHGSGEGPRGHKTLTWQDIGSKTAPKVQEILQTHQPLTWDIIVSLAQPKSRKDGPSEGGEVRAVRLVRPPEVVATEALSMLNFSHTYFARLLIASQSIAFFACVAPRTLHDYSSRVGITHAWSTTYGILRELAKEDAQELLELGKNPDRLPFIRLDNVQHYFKQWEQRMGRENTMNIGIAAYASDAINFNPAAVDLDEHLRLKHKNKRKDLTVSTLLNYIDFDHLDRVLGLQWLQVLATYIPSLSALKPQIAELYRSECGKMPLPKTHQTRVHPLATVAKNEANLSELKEAILDFLAQLGQTEDSYVRRLIPVGGDGMTFEFMLKIQNYLSYHQDAFHGLTTLFVFLETFHTLWTYLSACFEAHWGDALTKDPSRLGFSATKANQKEPTNLKKVDFYPASFLAYLVLDVQMLHCWQVALKVSDIFQHFEKLAEAGRTPTIEELRPIATKLYQQYSTRKACHQVLTGRRFGPTADIPTGRTWTGAESESMESRSDETADPSPASTTSNTQPTENAPIDGEGDDASGTGSESSSEGSSDDASEGAESAPLKGDQVLAQSIMMRHDFMLAREMSLATASGDPGRVYEALKMMLFSFAGSSHTKYPTYILEMICTLELESNKALKTLFLENWLVNPSGEAGKWQAGDLLQEHLNLELQRLVSRKNLRWDGDFMRKVASPNAFHFNQLKKDWIEGVGLAKRRGKHAEAHSKPEVLTLLTAYSQHQLHHFRPGRSYAAEPTVDANDLDMFSKGLQSLSKGKLAKWIADSGRARNLDGMLSAEGLADQLAEINENEDENDADDDEDNLARGLLTHGGMRIVDGELIIDVDDGTEEADEITAEDLDDAAEGLAEFEDDTEYD